MVVLEGDGVSVGTGGKCPITSVHASPPAGVRPTWTRKSDAESRKSAEPRRRQQLGTLRDNDLQRTTTTTAAAAAAAAAAN